MEILNDLFHWFAFQPQAPLTFTRLGFWIYLAVVLTGFAFMERKVALRNAFLFGVSLLFYWKTSGWFFLILLFSTGSDWWIGKQIGQSLGARRKGWLAVSLTINLLVLFYFKYAYFFADSINPLLGTHWQPANVIGQASNAVFGTSFRVDRILLPVGISFYTFQTMSYAIDVYRKEIEPVQRILDFGFYVSFFPQLVAGPIVRAKDFIPQLYKPYQLTRAGFGMGLFWILNGLIKKVWLADYLAVNLVDRIFSRPEAYSGFENLLGLYAYSLQVYADFSGYTDMAIGIAIWLGFRLPQNFNAPYKARNVGEFWQRWHMSLSSWLKDYLYIPMGGNRSGSFFTVITSGFILLFFALLVPDLGVLLIAAGALCLTIGAALWFPRFKRWGITNINVMLTMLIGGLWHGASWNFVLWGGLNGLGIIAYKLWRKISPWEGYNRWWKAAIGGIITFHFITATRIWFRSGSKTTWDSLAEGHNLLTEWFTANAMIHQLGQIGASPFLEILQGYAPLIGLMAAGFTIHLLPDSWKMRYRTWFSEASIGVQLALSVLGVSMAWQAMQAGMQPFIYFQF